MFVTVVTCPVPDSDRAEGSPQHSVGGASFAGPARPARPCCWGVVMTLEPLRKLPTRRERARAENRTRYSQSPPRDSAHEFLCECARPDCRVLLPLGVERHRRWSDRFIVGLTHANADNIVGVADHFLVVEANRIETAPRPSPIRPAHRRPNQDPGYWMQYRATARLREKARCRNIRRGFFRGVPHDCH